MTQEPWTPYNNRSPWVLLTQSEKDEFMACEGEIHYFSAFANPMKFAEVHDDIKPSDRWPAIVFRRVKPAPTKPDVDWSVLIDEIIHIARDEDDRVWGYIVKPYFFEDDGVWRAEEKCYCLDGLKSISPGTCDWRDSLIVRPGYEE